MELISFGILCSRFGRFFRFGRFWIMFIKFEVLYRRFVIDVRFFMVLVNV